MDLIERQAAIDALLEEVRLVDGYYVENDEVINKDDAIEAIRSLPPAQPEPTRIISETRAIPSDDDCVSLSETVTATYYDEENEEWSRKIVTVRDVLDSVCDEYTVLPSVRPEPKEIDYTDCANAMLKMWIDNVLTDGEYSRIMDKLHAHWAERREEGEE